MINNPGPTTSNDNLPLTAAAASRYQQLRGHLATLRLRHRRRAAPSRPRPSQHRRTQSLTAALERLLALEVDATEARRLAGRLRFACLPTPATLGRLRLRRRLRHRPAPDRRARHLPLPRIRHQRAR